MVKKNAKKPSGSSGENVDSDQSSLANNGADDGTGSSAGDGAGIPTGSLDDGAMNSAGDRSNVLTEKQMYLLENYLLGKYLPKLYVFATVICVTSVILGGVGFYLVESWDTIAGVPTPIPNPTDVPIPNPADVPTPIHSPADMIRSISEEHFPPQPTEFWDTITSEMRNAVDSEGNSQPSCMVFTAHVDHVGADKSVELLGNEMENLLSSSPTSLVIQGGEHNSQLEDRISEWFNEGKKVAVIHDIEKLSVETAKLLHKFCDDNPNPTYPGTIILLTLDHKSEDVIDKYWLQKVLRHHWTNDDDALTPLLSRIGNKATIIRRHPADVIRSVSEKYLPLQTEEFWDSITSSLRKAITVKRDGPTSWIALSSKRDQVNANMAVQLFADELAGLMGTSARSLVVEGETSNSGDQQSKLDEKISDWFGEGNRVVVIHDVEKLSVETAQLLHKYYEDNPNSTYPGTVILLTLDHHKEDVVDKQWLKTVLRHHWSGNEGVINPLLSRVNNSVLRIKRRPGTSIPSVSDNDLTLDSKLIKTSIKTVADSKGNSQPSCMVFTANVDHVGADKSVELLANEMENLLSSSPTSLVIQGKVFDGENQKSEMDKKISDWFDKGNRVVVIHDVEKLTVKTAKLFYKFCDDNWDPVYPGTVLLLTSRYKRGDTVDQYWFDNVLRHHWSNNEDTIGPLLSRVAHTVIAVTKHPAEMIKSESEKYFPLQSKEFWETIKLSVQQTINPKGSGRPSCMVFTADVDYPSADKSVQALANEMENLLSSSTHSLTIQGRKFSDGDQRSEVDKKISGWFDKGNRVVVIHDVEKLTVKTAKLFYKFCDDNPNPTYPGTVVILTSYHKSEEVVDQSWFDNVLRHHWSSNEDIIGPLLSRVAHTVITIKK